jgi:hypothetical protein
MKNELDNIVEIYGKIPPLLIHQIRRNQMNDIQTSPAYWAGLFDGEGCVSLQRYLSKTHNQKFIIAVKAVVTQKEPMILYLLQRDFGGAVRSQKQVTMSGKQTEVGRWEIGKAEEVSFFFKAIEPYVIIKKKEIVVALELLERIVVSRGNYNLHTTGDGRKYLSGKVPISLEEIKKRQLLEMKFWKDRQDPKRVQLIVSEMNAKEDINV